MADPDDLKIDHFQRNGFLSIFIGVFKHHVVVPVIAV
jgi:hypothetical protein